MIFDDLSVEQILSCFKIDDDLQVELLTPEQFTEMWNFFLEEQGSV